MSEKPRLQEKLPLTRRLSGVCYGSKQELDMRINYIFDELNRSGIYKRC